MDLIEDDEGELLEELCAVDDTLEEDAVSDEDYAVVRVHLGLHADLIPDFVLLPHLTLEDGLEVQHC